MPQKFSYLQFLFESHPRATVASGRKFWKITWKRPQRISFAGGILVAMCPRILSKIRQKRSRKTFSNKYEFCSCRLDRRSIFFTIILVEYFLPKSRKNTNMAMQKFFSEFFLKLAGKPGWDLATVSCRLQTPGCWSTISGHRHAGVLKLVHF